MRTLIVALGLTTALVTSAMAADLPVKAPAYKAPPIPVYSWTGFYIGVHGGGAWSRGDSRSDPLPSPDAFNRLADVFSLDGSGGLAGVHAGYNWQVAPTWLLGIEADWSWTNSDASTSLLIRALNGAVFPGGNGAATTMSRDLDWLASVRARVGFVMNNLLLYGTAGVAWGDVKYGATTPSIGPGFIWAANPRETEVGFVVGGGAEWGFTPNLTLRGEYLYYRLSGESVVVDGVPPFPPFQVRYTWDRFETHVARVGLSYKFGGPIVARY